MSSVADEGASGDGVSAFLCPVLAEGAGGPVLVEGASGDTVLVLLSPVLVPQPMAQLKPVDGNTSTGIFYRLHLRVCFSFPNVAQERRNVLSVYLSIYV